MTNTRTEAKPETRVFAFDIDNVLVTPIESYDDIDIEYLHSLHKNNLIIAAAGMEHIIHPGVIELIQYLDQLPSVRFCFFSAGIEIRNKELIKQLLIKALGETRYNEIKENIIFSRKDLDIVNKKYKKNLNTVLRPGEKLVSTILIDDRRENLLDDQLKNGLVTLCSNLLVESKDEALNHLLNNQIFYITGRLQQLLEQPAECMPDYLFNLQYKAKSVLEREYALYTLADEKDLYSEEELKLLSQNDRPALVKAGEKIFLLGKPRGTKWEFTELNKNIIEFYVTFPSIDETDHFDFEILKETSTAAEPLINELSKGHSTLSASIYSDKSVYLKGLEALQKYNKELSFFGDEETNQYFGIEPKKSTAIEEKPTSTQSPHTFTFFKPMALSGAIIGGVTAGLMGSVIGGAIGLLAPTSIEKLAENCKKSLKL